MPSNKTEATEIAVGFGLLLTDPETVSPQAAQTAFDNTLSPAKFGRFLREYKRNQAYYQQFFQLGREIRLNFPPFLSTKLTSVRWEGPTQQASTASVAKDLVAANTPLSVKADSSVVRNSSPYNLFVSSPQGTYSETSADNWYLEVAHEQYQTLYALVRDAWCPECPASVEEYHRIFKNNDRKRLARYLGKTAAGMSADFQQAYISFCHAVAIESAQRFNEYFATSIGGKAKNYVIESMLRQFFRVDSSPYLLCGLDHGEKFAVLIPDISSWKRDWQLLNISAKPDLTRKQSVVDFFVEVRKRRTREEVNLAFHAEIRWSHGKFVGHPEAKLYKGAKGRDWRWIDVPFFPEVCPYSSVGTPTQRSGYVRLDVLGSGGFGTVFRAKLPSFKIPVAVKELSSFDASLEDRERFRREIEVQQLLCHDNIVPILEHGDDEGNLWYAMPISEGSLADLIDAGPIPQAYQRRIICQILNAMEYAHSRSVVHRDLKTANVLIYGENDVKIADFGLGKSTDTSIPWESLTTTGEFIGSFEYAAPEQLADMKQADFRSDIYSLGKIIYEIATGRSAFPRPDLDFLDQETKRVVAKCILDDPQSRFQTITELRDALGSTPFRC